MIFFSLIIYSLIVFVTRYDFWMSNLDSKTIELSYAAKVPEINTSYCRKGTPPTVA